ncbi:CCR4-NOT transcription complex subunit 1 [Seminavis robusta]|uniref:CCR4-NOT transcription complex subunit 1 n=1 Tax=Seminavis robusta TaxID=568900 RepID=A0A9N8EG69_9STRA|nr:CCR4-NOT transcription complex subunit 1 [Seminavis robusta]|eukprot:Sro944_g222970.1 CCR4-NOT transcription complex subunit 1 (2367) ;mRNA; f:22930-30436
MNSETDIQQQQPQQQHSDLIITGGSEEATEEPRAPEATAGPSQTLGRAAPRSGAYLVEVYGRVVRKQHNFFSPNTVLLDFTKYLADLIKGDSTARLKKEAVALLDVINLSFQSEAVRTWDQDFVSALVDLLTTHPVFDKKPALEETIAKLKQLHQIEEIGSMEPSLPLESLTSLIPGVADRMSVSDASDPSIGIANLLQDIGPACTRSASTLRETIAEVTSTGGNLSEAAIARIIYFFSDKSTGADVSSNVATSALLGSLIPGRNNDATSLSTDNNWNLKAVAQILEEDYGDMDWPSVARKFDIAGFMIKDVTQFRTLLDLYRGGAKASPPIAAFTSPWRNTLGQLTLIESIMAVPPTVFLVPLNDEELADANTAPPNAQTSGVLNPRCWASMDILQRLLYLSDVPTLYRRVRDLFVKGLLTSPETLLCGLVRLQLRVANAATQPGSDNYVNAGMQMKTELMRELIPLFFRPDAYRRVQNGPAAFRRLYVISPSTVTAACFEAWRSTSNESPQVRLATIVHIINIARLLPSPGEAIASLLNGSKDAEFSIAIAIVMADNDYLQLKPWLVEKLSSKTSAFSFAVALVTYLGKTFGAAGPKGGSMDGKGAPLVSLENLLVSLQVLQSLDAAMLAQPVHAPGTEGSNGSTLGDNLKALLDACANAHPSLRASLTIHMHQQQQQQMRAASGGSNRSAGPSSAGASDDVEEMATAYFQKIYTSEQSIGEVVEMLKRFKTSGNAKENEIFACMVHNLFDEYRFFSKYPEKELRITGILFGTLIQEQLVSSITLGIALRYVLEALRKPPSPPGQNSSSGKMFKFGMFALEQFKGRLHEWPQYCSHIVQIPHLKERYAGLVAEIENAMSESQNRAANNGASGGPAGVSSPKESADATKLRSGSFGSDSNSGHTSKSVEAPLTPSREASSSELSAASGSAPSEANQRVAEFGVNLGRAVSESADEDRVHEAPTDVTLDRVQFLVNNLAPSNVEQKAQELKEMLEPKYFGWLGHFLVVKRISTQANFHQLYLSLLDNLGEYGKGLVEAILDSVYHNIGKLLRSPKITTSSSERSYLKNLGIWLGQITLARNRPILQIMLDCKELLLQGYETGKLIAVAPFLAKTLEGAKNSVVFRPPNPWLMGILGVFRAVYGVEGLKMNIKFEVEVLCKNLSIKLEDIPQRRDILASRVAPVKERNPDFNIKSTSVPKTAPVAQQMSGSSMIGSPEAKTGMNISSGMSVASNEGSVRTSGGEDQQDTVIPNLAAYVTVNPSLPQLLQSQGGAVLAGLNSAALKRCVPIAVDRAIREIIQPVVERSVTIACITTKEIVTKDFAMESDEAKMRKAGQLMVANLAGSLALVTCREPLRSSVSTHLRQLLTASIGRPEKLGDQEQNAIEQCVQICATDNLELGCMLIEKAATEKAVRDVDEALAQGINTRRKHREQTGQPFYDMSIFGNGSQRYPAALPDQLRPKPGGLRAEHFQLYDSFQRMPRQASGPGAMGAASAAGGNMGLAGARSQVQPTGEPDLASKAGATPQFGIEALSSLAAKMDSSVTTILTAAGPRAPEIKLSMLPPEHQIRQILGLVKQVMPNASQGGGMSRPLTQSEQESVLAFSQSIFKRLYELSLSEPLRLEALVALLENINMYCPQLGKDIGTWATYAPANSDPQRRLHRTVLLLLVRSNLLRTPELDAFLAAKAENGRNHVWVEFSLLFIRTAFMERIALPSDFPKLIELMTRIAEGRSQAPPQMVQTYRKPILRMLEETRSLGGAGVGGAPTQSQPQQQPPMQPPQPQQQQSLQSQKQPHQNGIHSPVASSEPPKTSVSLPQSSSLSSLSLSNFSTAALKVTEATDVFTRSDPANARQQVTSLLDGWIRIHSEASANEKTFAQYLQLLQQFGVGKVEESTERFFRVSSLVVVDAVLKSATGGVDGSKAALNYTFVDIYSSLLVLMFKHMHNGGTPEQIGQQRLGVLNKILGVLVRTMMWDCEKAKKKPSKWDQRPWFRLLLNLVMDLNKPGPMLEPIRPAILNVFGAAFHVSQPLVMPGFAFAWLELVSHRHYLPNLLLLPGQKGWNLAQQLLVDHFLFLEPYLRKTELTPAIKKLYEGTLRVLLVLLHDFPSFLAGYHLSFCNVIPDNCVQLRNIVLSANPKGMLPPDPFTPNLKIDLLPEISQSPTILSNVLGPIDSLRGHLDAYLKDGQRRAFLTGLPALLYKEGTTEVDAPKVNSLVLYIGIHALARLQNNQISLSHTPEMEVLQKLMELDDRGRYICLNAIANQLRYPSSHTHYFSCVMLFLFSESKNVAVKEQVTRVLLERLILHRPHPWGLLVTFIELIKNQRYGFWNYPFTRCASEIEKVFESVARSCMPPGSQRTTLVGGGDE